MAPVVTQTGQVLGERYRLDKRIATGGVGQVWLASDLLLSRPVAVKVLRPEYADHHQTLDRFRKEARHAGSLSHPHVAQVYDYGPAGPGWPPFLVMEFVDGPSLADILVVDPVEPAFALDVVAQAADGLSAAHRAGLVHRDVKPGNLLIGPDGLVKVTDFGIAHAAGQAPVTGPNLVMGTTQYMAPERISGGPGTPASDLYALGIVLHECLTGVPPYEGSPSDVMAAHLYLPLPPLPADVPPELDELVARLTAKDPAARISDARQLAGLASALRDAVMAGHLVPSARAGSLSGSGPAAGPVGAPRPASFGSAQLGGGVLGPTGLTDTGLANTGLANTGLANTALASTGVARTGLDDTALGYLGLDQPGVGVASPGRTQIATTAFPGTPASRAGDAVAGPGQHADEWTVPAGMSPEDPPPPGPRRERDRRPRLPLLIAAVAAGMVVTGLLLTGALRSAPTGNPGPARSPSGAARPAGPSPRGVARVSNPASSARATAPAARPGTPRPAGTNAVTSPHPTARPSRSGSSSPSPTPSQGAPDSPSGSPSDSSPASPPASPTGSAPGSPSPDPGSSSTAPVCVLTVCL